jgi:hypothetical protein
MPAPAPSPNPFADRCGICRFGTAEGAPPGQIICRRFPPTVIIASALAQPVGEREQRPSLSIGVKQPNVIGVLHTTNGVQGHFPLMHPDTGWCGEFQLRASERPN